tara:strand:- start:742 stop:936 length:195 start_codon:yes stop_codon:yes gene_type:complete
MTDENYFNAYEASFLSLCDEQGNVPDWAFWKIFDQHGSAVTDFTDSTPNKVHRNGVAILNWLGY